MIPKDLKCPECGDKLVESTTFLEMERQNISFTVKSIPARKCEKCGEEFIDGPVAAYVDEIV